MTFDYILTAQLLDVLERISELDDDCDIGFLSPTLADAVTNSIVDLKAATPDCRTCAHIHTHARSGNRWCVSDVACTNGGKYQPAAPVVLWRTE